MAQLIILYDPNNKVNLRPEDLKCCEVNQVILTISDDLEAIDIYTLARKLAEMLLEQL